MRSRTPTRDSSHAGSGEGEGEAAALAGRGAPQLGNAPLSPRTSGGGGVAGGGRELSFWGFTKQLSSHENFWLYVPSFLRRQTDVVFWNCSASGCLACLRCAVLSCYSLRSKFVPASSCTLFKYPGSSCTVLMPYATWQRPACPIVNNSPSSRGIVVNGLAS